MRWLVVVFWRVGDGERVEAPWTGARGSSCLGRSTARVVKECLSLKVGEATVLSVLCDQRLRLAMPSAAALLRGLAPGGVDSGMVWGGLTGDFGSSWVKEAGRWTVTTDDEERELLRRGGRAWSDEERLMAGLVPGARCAGA